MHGYDLLPRSRYALRTWGAGNGGDGLDGSGPAEQILVFLLISLVIQGVDAVNLRVYVE
jgi:hypothetical protein